jgi:hypothetical protein
VQQREAAQIAEKVAQERLQLLQATTPVIAVTSYKDAGISEAGWLLDQEGKPTKQVIEGPVRLARFAPDGNRFVVTSGAKAISGSRQTDQSVELDRADILRAVPERS